KMVSALVVFLWAALATGTMVGRESEVHLEAGNPVVVDAIRKINQFYSASGDTRLRTLVRVVNATQQIVRGTKYQLELEVNCLYNQTDVCSVSVVYATWLPPPDDITYLKEPVKMIVFALLLVDLAIAHDSKAGLSYIDLDREDPIVLEAMKSIIEFCNRARGGEQVPKLVKIDRVRHEFTSQGNFYILELIVTADKKMSEICTVKVFKQAEHKLQSIQEPVCYPPFGEDESEKTGNSSIVTGRNKM
ncbi:hypothetical protein Btru_063783, partial [Bulinus truncatus]